MDREEHSLFLMDEHGPITDQAEEELPFIEKPSEKTRYTLFVSLFANVLLLLTLIFSLSPLTRHSVPGEVEEPYSPANTIIEYEYRMMQMYESPFLGAPGRVWEEHMYELLNGTLLRVSAEELELAGSESIPLREGGFAAGLGVAHNMHCVKKLKQFLYFRQAYPEHEMSGPRFDHIQSHADHCLDFIRQSALCHLDASLYTLVWAPAPGGEKYLDHRLPGVQKCVNWGKLQDWMKSRSTTSDMLMQPAE